MVGKSKMDHLKQASLRQFVLTLLQRGEVLMEIQTIFVLLFWKNNMKMNKPKKIVSRNAKWYIKQHGHPRRKKIVIQPDLTVLFGMTASIVDLPTLFADFCEHNS